MIPPPAPSNPSPSAASPDVGPPPPATAGPPVVGRDPTPPARARPVRRWLRRLLVVVGIVALLVIALRVVAWIAIPIALDELARSMGLELQTRDVSVSVIAGDVELQGVRATALSGAPRVLAADYLRANLAILPLLRGDIVLERVELDGVDVLIDRSLRDEVELMRRFDEALRPLLEGEATASAAAAAAEEETTGQEERAGDEPKATRTRRSRPLRYDLPVSVRRLAVHHLRVRVIDPLVTPPVDVRARLEIEISDLEVGARRPLRFDIELEASPLARMVRATGRARLGREQIEAYVRLEASGLRPGAIGGWLTPAGVTSAYEELSLGADAMLELRPSVEDPGYTGARFALDRLRVTGDGEDLIVADRVEAELERLGQPGVRVQRLEVVGVRGGLRRLAGGEAIEVAGLRIPLPPDTEEEEPTEGPTIVGDVVLRDIEVVYTDEELPLTLPARIERLRLGSVDSRNPERPARFEAQLSAAGIARSAVLTGDVWPFPPHRGAAIDVSADGLTLEALAPLLERSGLRPALADGRLTASLRLLVKGVAPGEAVEPLPGDRPDIAQLKRRKGPMSVSAHVEGLRLTDGGRELVALDLVDVPAIHVDPFAGRVDAERIVVRGPRLALRRTPDGTLLVAGVGIAPAELPAETPRAEGPPPADGDADDHAEKAEDRRERGTNPDEEADRLAERAAEEIARAQERLARAQGTATGPDFLQWRLRARHVHVDGIQLSLVDEAVQEGQPIELALQDAGLRLEEMDLALAPDAAPGAPARLVAWASLPGVIDRLEVQGTADASHGRLAVAVDVGAHGITFDRLAAYLAAVGVESDLEDGSLEVHVAAEAMLGDDGLLAGHAMIESATLVDGGRRLLDLRALRALGMRAATGLDVREAYGIDRVELEHLELPVQLASDGSVGLLGLRFGRVKPDIEVTEEAASTGLVRPLVSLPLLELGGIDLARVLVHITDERHPGDDLEVGLELAVGRLLFDPTSPRPPSSTPFALRAHAPGAAQDLSLRGAVALAPDLIRAETLLTGHGLTERLVSSIPGLHMQHLAIDEGHVRARAAMELVRDGELLRARVDLGPATLADRSGELAGIDLAHFGDVALGPDGIRVGQVDVREPRLRVVREGADVLRIAGWRVAPELTPPTAEPAPGPEPALSAKAAPLAWPAVDIDRASLRGLRVELTDPTVTPAVTQTLTADAVLHDLSSAGGRPPGDLRVVVLAPGAIDRIVLGGKIALAPSRIAAELTLDARGVRSQTLASYLPGLTVTDGRARATFGADLRAHEEGGYALRASVRDVTLSEGARPLLRADGLWLDAPRLDPERLLELAQLHGRIEAVELERTAAGLSLAGIPLGGSKPKAANGGQPASGGQGPPATAPAAAPLGTRTRPVLRVGVVDIGVGRIRLTDTGRGQVLADAQDLRLRTLGPLETLGAPDQDRRPMVLELTGKVAPFARSVMVRVEGDPLAMEPEVDLTVELTGLDGEDLTTVAPELAARIDGRRLRDGYLRLHTSVLLRTGRRDPLDFSFLESGFGARVEILGFQVRDGGPRGTELLALDEAFADIERLSPREARADIRMLELYRPRLTVTRVPDGYLVGGLLFKPGPETPEEEEPSRASVRLDELSIVDLDATFEDRTVMPPFVAPIRGLEATLTGLDTREARAGGARPFAFQVHAFAGSVTVPPRPARGFGRVTGAVTGFVRLLGGAQRGQVVDRVPLFNELSARGVVELTPQLRGRMTLNLRGLELRGLIGLAAKGGIDLSDGALDLDTVVDLGGGGEADVQVGSVIERLSLTEPNNGPIQNLLAVPLSLDAVLFVLRDERGRIRISVDTEVPIGGELERGEIVGAVAEAVGEQALDAAAGLPWRILRPLEWLIDLIIPGTLAELFEQELEPVAVAFEPGQVALGPAQETAIRRLARWLRRNEDIILVLQHDVGTADASLLAGVSDPDPAHDRDLIARLEVGRAELLWRRSDAEARARTAFAAARQDDAQDAIHTIQRLEDALGRIEGSLAQAYDRLGNRSDRLAGRRSRAAAQELAEARLALVRQMLCAAGVRAAEHRVWLGAARYVPTEGAPTYGLVIARPQEPLIEDEESRDILEEDTPGEPPEEVDYEPPGRSTR